MFPFSNVQTGSEAHPASYQVGTGGISPGIKRPGCEAEHSPATSGEVKNACSYTSTPQYVLGTWSLIKHRDVAFTCCHNDTPLQYSSDGGGGRYLASPLSASMVSAQLVDIYSVSLKALFSMFSR
jgi:hypothetical protein